MDQDMSQQKRPLTLRDVSEVSGVSEMTVSRVLRNRGDVSAATRDESVKRNQNSGLCAK
jgi:LacI family gluconate utilization system Gnt-I transcriptional repressor